LSLALLIVSFAGSPLSAQGEKTGKSKAKAKTTEAQKAPATPVDLNTATQAELEALPEVGASTAKKIIAGRPYTSVADLAKAGVSKKTIEKITPMVTVGAAKAAPATPPAAPPAAAPTTPTTPATKGMTTPTTAQTPPQKGMVWVNLNTKVYHKEGDPYYGKTKNGKWMTEDEAIKAGYRAAKEGAAKKKK
jgi:hypothetical protein